MKAFRVFAACALLFVAGIAHADFSGVVVGVLDGDTVDVLIDQKPVRVRLAEIDAPEKAQAFGTRSRQALAAAVFKQAVDVRTTGVDRYGRTIGTLLVDGHSVNRMMVAQGMAWVYRQYLVDRSLLVTIRPVPCCNPARFMLFQFQFRFPLERALDLVKKVDRSTPASCGHRQSLLDLVKLVDRACL